MSIRPVAFHADGSVDVVHDDAPRGAHSGTVPAAQLSFAAMLGSGHDHRFVTLPCPVAACGFSSVHPVGGGAAPAAVQEMFVRLAARAGCACGQLPANSTLTSAQSHIKLQAQRMGLADGASRWQVQGQIA